MRQIQALQTAFQGAFYMHVATVCEADGLESKGGQDFKDEETLAASAGLVCEPLARQKYWQIRTNFTTLLLHNYNLNSDYKDYSKNLLASLTCLVYL